MADFNGDGKPDLLSGDGTLQLGNGNGTFANGTAVAGTPLAVADFNGDGKPDVLEQGTGTLLVLLGRGDGTFQAPTSTSSGASLMGVIAGDVNGDGKADVLGVFNNAVVVYLSKGDGTFAAGVSYSLGVNTSYGSSVLILGDFNGDGKSDVAGVFAGNLVPGQEIVLLGNGDGSFQPPLSSAGVYFPDFVVAGDFNGDGKLDLAVSSPGYCALTCTPRAEVYFLLGNGNGTFQSPVAAFPGDGPLATADFNGDGKLDLVLEPSPTVAQICLGNGDGTFLNGSSYLLSFVGRPSGLSGIAIADFNLDGKLDSALGGAVLLGNGNGTLQGIQLGATPYPAGSGALGQFAVLGDFANSGITDVAMASNGAVGNTNFYNVDILMNNSAGALSLSHTYTLQEPASGIVTADFNGDGNLDLVVIDTDPITLDWSYSVLLGNGDGTFQSPVFYPQNVTTGALFAFSIIVADFNNDGKLDIAASLGGGGNQSLVVLLGKGDGTFSAPAYYYDAGAFSLVTAGFNGDGKLDIAAAANSGGGTSGTWLLFGSGDGTFHPAVFPTNLNNFLVQFTADVNNDGKPDLLGNEVALGNGDGTFTVLPQPLSVINALSDLNGDGKLDLIVEFNASAHQLGSGAQLGNGDGTFGPLITLIPQNDLPPFGSLLVADMNGDGRPDIIFVDNESVPVYGVAVLLNTTAVGFGLSATAFSPATVIAGSSATSTVRVTPTFGFMGTVSLTCSIGPTVTPPATCSLSSSSVQIIAGKAQSVTVTVATTAAVTTGAMYPAGFPPAAMPLAWTVLMLGSGWLFLRSRKRLPGLAVPLVVLVFVSWIGCGGGGSSPHTTPGTPAGTYTATVTASSSGQSQSMPLKVTVQ